MRTNSDREDPKRKAKKGKPATAPRDRRPATRDNGLVVMNIILIVLLFIITSSQCMVKPPCPMSHLAVFIFYVLTKENTIPDYFGVNKQEAICNRSVA